ncbi:MAG: ABC transporter ATP-binding protein, partial [Synechococcales cyanobacterium RM1_1_8]|nr:ABC transporter ATP-binding protein [Synechococcales cyanobacterium RM1_1_8]
MNIPDLKPAQALRRSLAMVAQAAPRELAQIALFNLLTGAGPAATLFLSKLVIDELSRQVQLGPVADWRSVVNTDSVLLWALIGSLALRLIVEITSTVDILLFASLRDRVEGAVQGQVLAKIASFSDIALFESPDLLNIVQLTEKGVGRIQRLSFMISGTLSGLMTFFPAVLLAASLDWWIPLLLIAITVPSVWVEMGHRRRSWRVETTQAETSRKLDIYARLIRGENYAKEIRLFSLQRIMIDRWRDYFTQRFSAMAEVRKEGAIAMAFWSCISSLGAAVPYVFVVIGVVQGRFTLGDIALYTGIIAQMQGSLTQLIANLGEIYDVTLATKPIFQLLDLQPDLTSPPQEFASKIWQSTAPQTGIEVQDLAFAYPGSDKPILQGINFQIKPNELVALVGENGAGKTTLGKLLCRLYDPTQGAIYWNGKDYRELDLGELRDRIAVVMQDYARFPTTLRENVGWGYQPKLEQDSAIQAVLAEAGVARLVKNYDLGLETPLGKELQ